MRDTGYRVVEKEVNASHPLKANCLLSNLANVVVHQLGFSTEWGRLFPTQNSLSHPVDKVVNQLKRLLS